MEVGEQPVHRAKGVAGGDEDRGVARERMDLARLVGRAFEQAQARRPHRNDPPAAGAHRVEPRRSLAVDRAPFGVHRVVGGILDLHRKKRPRADVERQRLVADPRRAQRCHQFGREMERRGRRGDRTIARGKHRLVIAAISLVGAALAGDVRW